MTSKAGSRSDSALSDIDDDAYAALKKRQLRHAQILDGASPSYEELLSGMPFRHDDLQSDVMAAIDDWSAQRDGDVNPVHASLSVAIEAARRHADADTLHTLSEELGLSRHLIEADGELWQRCQVWLAYFGADDPIDTVVSAAINAYRWTRVGVDGVYRIGWAVGLKLHRGSAYEAGFADKIVTRGLANLDRISTLISPISASCTTPTGLSALIAKQRPEDDDEDRAVGALETLLESGVFEDDRDETLTGAGIIVVPKMGDGVGGQREVRKTWKSLSGIALPVVHRGDVAEHKRALTARYPHASDVIDIMLRDLAPRETAWFRPTLLIGSPGSGKSSLLRAIADQIGLPCELNSLAGSTDSSAMGTSAQWSTVRESVPLQLIKRSRHASVAMIWDEVDKSSSSRNNGSIIDALLPLLEPDQSRRYRDLALEVEVDLSGVTHFATANDLHSVPQALRDRFRILAMPEPTWAHLGTLTKQIVDRIARERGIDPRFFEPLGQDEMDNVRRKWPGGSIRQLTQILTIIIDRRDQIMGRC
jgi:hypothetical protein